IQTEHASTTIHGINVKINDSPEKMCGITRAGRPRSSPRRFAAIVGCADIGVLVLSVRFPLQLSACADVTARRSVTHLTFSDASWRSVVVV
ncbi:MAG: hypothetical protein LBQ66_12935, partial [Planctomycetaceae bacterium]|nr:hypothetical protein [Planctomycetaceae bacterium]